MTLVKKELVYHHNEINNKLIEFCKDNDLAEYLSYANHSVFNYYEWSFILKKLFDNFHYKGDIMQILAGSEMILLAAYLKDDIIDNTKHRNNKVTFSKKYGAGTTSLFSDYLFTNGLKLIYKNVVELSNEQKAILIQNSLIDGFQKSAKGQIISCLKNINDNNVENNLNLIKLKTNSLLEPIFSIPAVLFAQNYLDLYKEFANNLGYAFQIHNDLVDFIGNSNEIGKPLFEDIINKQANIVIAFYLENIESKDESDIVVNLWNNNISLSQSTSEQIINKLIQSKSLDRVYDLFLSYNLKAIDNLNDFPNKEVASFFALFIEYLVKFDDYD